MILTSFLFIIQTQLENTNYQFPKVDRSAIFENKKVLLIVPHEDDEINVLGGVLEQYALNSSVFVAFVTNGDYKEDASVRIQEAINALAHYAIPEENILFLGYGDQWKTTKGHIYHTPGDEVIPSRSGHTQTYGTPSHPPYSSSFYTRNNILKDMKSIINEYRPDTIFCVEFEPHIGHRAVSLFFEEAMGVLLNQETDYIPDVFKGFAYSTAWWSPNEEFYLDNIISAKNPTIELFMKEVNVYNWADRVRFPVSEKSLSRTLVSNATYHALTAHQSQYANQRSGRVIKGDKVFWKRDTNSILYTSHIRASSGDISVLNDFKLIDSTNITDLHLLPTANVWTPDDTDATKSIDITFSNSQTVSEVRLYDSPSLLDNILNARIDFSDGSSLETKALSINGAATSIVFEPKANITGFVVTLLDFEGDQYGLTEIEAYNNLPDTNLQFIKLQDKKNNFAYDYWTDQSGYTQFKLYTYPNQEIIDISKDYKISVDGTAECSATFKDNKLETYCPFGESFILNITSKHNNEVYDAIRITNPTKLQRSKIQMLRNIEQEYLDYLPHGQVNYYVDIIKALYKKVFPN
ncbi:MAG: PIG-L family deacetylase [Clostridiales bacterium]|nr:PIG-L family deacetylase [Clostridiales bacterium]